MGFAITHTRASIAISAPLVKVETHIASGLPQFNIVGLSSTAAKESKERVRSAIINSNFSFPVGRITVNLSPADLPKDGGGFDLAIAISVLAAAKQIMRDNLHKFEFSAELGLNGDLKPVRNILPHALTLWKKLQAHNKKPHGKKVDGKLGHVEAVKLPQFLCIAQENLYEASLCDPDIIKAHTNLLEVTQYFNKQNVRPAKPAAATPVPATTSGITTKPNTTGTTTQPATADTNCWPALPDDIEQQAHNTDFADIVGQNTAKRALIIGAAGGHNILLIGSPGVGKTLLANTLPSLLPALDRESALEVASIYADCKLGFNPRNWRRRPFRAPHHTCSHQALVGGGRPPQPGEVSLAHNGILFLDELTEFNRHSLEALREPLEARQISIARAAYHVHYPANFQLIAAMNPCPCGYAGSHSRPCRCSPLQVQRYQHKLSGPLLDRIDMTITMSDPQATPHPTYISKPQPKQYAQSKPKQDNLGTRNNDDNCNQLTSRQAKQIIIKAQHMQINRQGCLNSQLNITGKKSQEILKISPQAGADLKQAISHYILSNRHQQRLIKVARSIADVATSEQIQSGHLAEAINLACHSPTYNYV